MINHELRSESLANSYHAEIIMNEIERITAHAETTLDSRGATSNPTLLKASEHEGARFMYYPDGKKTDNPNSISLASVSWNDKTNGIATHYDIKYTEGRGPHTSKTLYAPHDTLEQSLVSSQRDRESANLLDIFGIPREIDENEAYRLIGKLQDINQAPKRS